MTIRAIETRYAGCRFRSRLEARWAVFFDHLGIRWEYEPKGFETAAGPYLPDFRLPDGRLFVEIKGGEPTQRDLDRCAEIAKAAQRQRGDLIILVGDIPRTPHMIEWYQLDAQGADGPGWALRDWSEYWPFSSDGVHWDSTERALEAARSARFEHGESGAPAPRKWVDERGPLNFSPPPVPPCCHELGRLYDCGCYSCAGCRESTLYVCDAHGPRTCGRDRYRTADYAANAISRHAEAKGLDPGSLFVAFHKPCEAFHVIDDPNILMFGPESADWDATPAAGEER